MPHHSKRITITTSEIIYQHLAKLAIEHDYLDYNEEPNVTAFIRDAIIRPILNLNNMDKMQEFKEKKGRRTMDIIRSATILCIEPDDDESKKRVSPYMVKPKNK